MLEHLGLEESEGNAPASPRQAKSQFAQAAKTPAFTEIAESVGQVFNRKGAAWKRRAGVLRYQKVSIAKRLAAHYEEALAEDDDYEQADELFRRFAREVEQQGFVLIRNEFLSEERCTLLLFPTAEKYAAIRSIGTNGNNCGHNTHDVIAWLQEMEEQNPFRLLAAMHDGMEGEFLNEVQNAEELARRMLEFCPDLQSSEHDDHRRFRQRIDQRAHVRILVGLMEQQLP